MINKAILISVSLLLFMFVLNAQQVPCGYDYILKSISQDQTYSEDVSRVFNQAKDDSDISRKDEVYVIPITFHVVWKDSLENIDDSLFTQQIEVLNDAYRRTNANADEVRIEYKDIVSDANIEFKIKEIIRVHTDTIFEVNLFSGLADYVKLSSEGGSDAVDPELNLNVWICDIKPFSIFGQEGKLLGYSYPPSGLSHWPPNFMAPSPELDGVVVDFRAIGKNNPYDVEIPGIGVIQTEGRTLVHEIGHYLGLRHIWGDAQVPFEDGCAVDDGVDDTPNCYQASNFGCNHTVNSCETTLNGDLPDMVENYMDYSEEACMNSFTIGQIGIMRGVLRNVRCKLVGNCDYVANDDIDIQKIQLYPNPASDRITINGDFGTQKVFVSVYNTLGSLMTQTVLKGNSVDVSNLSSGLYFVELQVGEELFTKKLMIR